MLFVAKPFEMSKRHVDSDEAPAALNLLATRTIVISPPKGGAPMTSMREPPTPSRETPVLVRPTLWSSAETSLPSLSMTVAVSAARPCKWNLNLSLAVSNRQPRRWCVSVEERRRKDGGRRNAPFAAGSAARVRRNPSFAAAPQRSANTSIVPARALAPLL